LLTLMCKPNIVGLTTFLKKLLNMNQTDDPMGKLVWARVVNHDTFSDGFWKLVNTWMETCRRDHKVCSPNDSMPLPTRVIDIGKTSQDPFLLHTRGRCGSWICLSYCWGNAAPFKTTLANLQDRCSRIPFEDLPPLFQDSVDITRRLGYRYLWIDSLCIVQDSLEDWLAESVNMGSIFKNSAITLAAEASPDSRVGLFQTTNRDREELSLQLNIPTFSKKHDLDGFLVCGGRGPDRDRLKGPLSKRAWTLQENMLPYRVLRFTESQVWWQCHSSQCNEHDPYGSDPMTSSWIIGESFAIKDSIDGPIKGLIEGCESRYNLVSWYSIVSMYATRGITFDKDVFPAISGLAREVQRGIGQEYKAGLWAQDIHRGLIWFAPRPCAKRRAAPYIAPSWSWASVDFSEIEEYWQSKYSPTDEIYHVHLQYSKLLIPVAKILNLQVSNKDRDPFGQVSDGRLQIQGPSRPICTCNVPHTFFDCHNQFAGKLYDFNKILSDLYPLSFAYYYVNQLELPCVEDDQAQHLPLLYLHIASHEPGDRPEPLVARHHMALCLILRPTPDWTNEYQRIGLATLRETTDSSEIWPLRTVTII
jgi:hypothetical protein